MTDTTCTECSPYTCSRCGRSWIEQPTVPTMPEVTPRMVTTAELARPEWADENPAEYAGDDSGGFFYAHGRMDQGHPPVVIHEGDATPTMAATSWLFGRMWAVMQHEYRSPNVGGYFPGIEAAWENFARSGGHTLRRR